MKIINQTQLDPERLKAAALFAIDNLSLPKDISIEINETWFEEDDNGKRTYDANIDWDGTANYPNKVWVIISPHLIFPFVWWVNEELEGKYIRGTVCRDEWEYIVYCVAHESRHLWQWKFPKRKRLWSDIGGDEETDSDAYAITKLWQWRLKQCD